METLGTVRTFTQDDADLVRSLAIELYRLRPMDGEQYVSAPTQQKTSLRERIFSALGRGMVGNISAPLEASKVRSILLFRYDALGDYIASSGLLDWLHAAIPNVAIDVVASYRNKAFLESDPRIRSVVAIHPAHSFRPSWLRVRAAGKKTQYDVLIAAVFTKMTKAAILTRLATRTALTVTIRHNDRAHIYGKVFAVQVPHRTTEHWAETMTRIGPMCVQPEQPLTAQYPPRIPIDASASAATQGWLNQRGIAWGVAMPRKGLFSTEPLPAATQGRRYVVVNISAYSPNRRWKRESCVPVIEELRRRYPHIAVLVSGAPQDAEEVRQIVSAINDVSVLAWQGSFLQLIALISGAMLLVSPDTATIHVAAAAEVPCVVMFAELIKVAEWYPYGVPFRGIVSATPETINTISYSTIVDAVVEMLPNV